MPDTEPLTRELGEPERRQWLRIPVSGLSVAIRHSAGQCPAQVLDNGFGGVALQVEDSTGLSVGQPVVILLGEKRLSAVVKRVEALDDQKGIRVALEWFADECFIRKILNSVLDATKRQNAE